MNVEEEERDPITCEVSGHHFHFYCRLFPDERSARRVFWTMTEASTGSSASVLLIRELEEEMTWGVLFFSEDRLEILAFSPFIHDFGQPYRSRFLIDAVRRRQAILATKALAGEHFFPAALLGHLDPDKLL